MAVITQNGQSAFISLWLLNSEMQMDPDGSRFNKEKWKIKTILVINNNNKDSSNNNNDNNNNNNNNENVTKILNNYRDNDIIFHGLDNISQMFESVLIIRFLMGSGKLLHKEGPMHDKVFCPVLVLPRGYLSIGKLFFLAVLQCRVNSQILFR